MRTSFMLWIASALFFSAGAAAAINVAGEIEFFPEGEDREVSEITFYSDEAATLVSVEFDWSGSNIEYSGQGIAGGLVSLGGATSATLSGVFPSRAFRFDYTGFDRNDAVVYALDLDRFSTSSGLPLTSDYGGGVATLEFSNGEIVEVVFDGVTDGRVAGLSNLASFVVGTPPPSPFAAPLDDQDPNDFPFSVGGSANSIRGWRFRVNAGNQVVGQIGAYTAVSDTESHVVALFDAGTGALLTWGTTTPGEGWRWANVAPVALDFGGEYVVTAHGSVSGWYFFGSSGAIGSSWFPNGVIEYLDARFANDVANPVTFPTTPLPAIQYGLVDIGFAPTTGIPVLLPGSGAGEIVDPVVGPPGKTLEASSTVDAVVLDLEVGIRLEDNSGPPPSATTPWDDLAMILVRQDAALALNANPTGAVVGEFDVLFDDETSLSIQDAKPGGDALGRYRPDGGALHLFDGRLLGGGRWLLQFEDIDSANDTRMDDWSILARTAPAAPILECGGPVAGIGDLADLRGIVFEVDQDFQGVRLNLASTPSGVGTYTLEAQLRRSSGFTSAVESVTELVVDLTNTPTPVLVPMDAIEVNGVESFSLKFVKLDGPPFTSPYFQTHGSNKPCPSVLSSEENDVASPTERGDPAEFRVIGLPEPGGLSLLMPGLVWLAAIGRRRGLGDEAQAEAGARRQHERR